MTIADFVADLRAPTPSAAAELVASASEELRSAIDRRLREAAAAVRYRFLITQSGLRELVASRALSDVPARVERHMQTVDDAHEAVRRIATARLTTSRTTFVTHARTLAARDPRRRVLVERERLARAQAAIPASARRAVELRRHAFADVRGQLTSLDPLAVLARGFAIVRNADGRIVRRPVDVGPGEIVEIRVAGGVFDARRTFENTDGKGNDTE